MPQREAKFFVAAPPEELWKFIRDFESLCSCVPGVEQIKLLDHKTAVLTVREKIGVVPLILTLTAEIDAEDPPRRLHANARAEHLTMEIDVALQEIESGTEMRCLFKVKGEGQLKPIVDSLFERRATERTAQFAESLARRFAGASSTGASARTPVTGGATQDRFARLGSWFKRVWLRLLGKSTPRSLP